MKNSTAVAITLIILIGGGYYLWLRTKGSNESMYTDKVTETQTPTPTIKLENNSDIDRELQKLDKSMDDAQRKDNDTDQTIGL